MNVVHIIVFLVSLCCVNVSVTENRRSNAVMANRRKQMRIRCTRRYTAGTCLEPVRPVWTFLAPLQSCQERLGCPAHEYANRFNSLEECSSACRELIYLFMFLQSSFENDTFKIPTEGPDNGVRPAEINAIYNEFMDRERGDDSSEDDTDDDEVPTIDHDFRRDLNEAISALPWDPLFAQDSDPDYSEEDQTSEEPSDDRPPLPSREELMSDDDLIVPDIDKFPE